MNSILQEIIAQKKLEVENLKHQIFDNRRENNVHKSFKSIFCKDELLIESYISGGVGGVSILTDEKFFAGTINDLHLVVEHLKNSPIPVLRKDFIIDKLQIDQSNALGANAILLIVSVLKTKTKILLDYAKKLGIEAIVEIHNEDELNYAISIGAEIIGINNRDLNSFKEDINLCLNLISKIPGNIYTVAESAIRSIDDIKKIKAAGFNAVLIGEMLMKANNPSVLIRSMREAI